MTNHTSPADSSSLAPSRSAAAANDQRESWNPALSASRAKEYVNCPLKYRLHVIDGIREPGTRATTMGTLVHSVLEHLYDAPATDRTRDHAQSLVDPQWQAMVTSTPELVELFDSPAEHTQWMEAVRSVVNAYFHIEDPQWLEPIGREERIDVVSAQGIALRGFIDRIDQSPRGDLRVVDYKTGKAPSKRYIDDALFQMRFYALLLKEQGRMPARTQLLYLKDGQVLTLDPQAEDIARFGEDVAQLWGRIEHDALRGHFAPRKNPLCGWCALQSLCPVFGGDTPDMPEERVARVLRTRTTTSV